MALASGSRLGPYEILTPLGAGGMGEVYRARDARLKRDVALKVLPDAFTNDADRLARFEREAQVLAALNHPRIAAIYGVEEAGTTRALVMELVEGETLADRIARGALPIEEALPIAQQIAEALEAAHEAGIIHRDLKPANIKLRPDGSVKVLDFGLAKALEQPSMNSVRTESPTITSPAMTQAGMILGTAAYMSPEQAKGKRVDKRTDIWAFGCVLYEMLTGRRAFDAEDVSETLAMILRSEPEWATLSGDVPHAIALLLRGCLEKDQRERVSDIAVARFQLRHAHGQPPAILPRRRLVPFIALAAVTLLIVGVLSLWLWTRESTPRPAEVVRFSLVPPVSAPLSTISLDRDLVLSPDGMTLLYASQNGLAVRALSDLSLSLLRGFGGAVRSPEISPDGRWVAAWVEGSLRRMPLGGGPSTEIARVGGGPRGLCWTADDYIVFGDSNPTTGLRRIRAGGGGVEVLTTPQSGEDHLWPSRLPNGRGLLFTIAGQTNSDSRVAVLNFATREITSIIASGTHPVFAASGHILYGSADAIRAVRFDPETLNVIGDSSTVVEDVATRMPGAVNLTLSDTGTLAYIAGGSAVRSLVWVDRDGRETPLAAPPRRYSYPRISPDGTRIAVEINDEDRDIWIWHVESTVLTRLTVDRAAENYPTWSPDGKSIFYGLLVGSGGRVLRRSADGTGDIEQVSAVPAAPYDTTPAGDQLVVRNASAGGAGSLDLGTLMLDGRGRIEPLIATQFTEHNADLSPDGRWITYQSNESGKSEVYVRPFPRVNDGRWQISIGGGTRPLFAPSGRELLYVDGGGALMSVPIGTDKAFASGRPMQILPAGFFAEAPGRTYDISADGKRFLMIKETRDASPLGIVVVLNWLEELKRRVPSTTR